VDRTVRDVLAGCGYEPRADSDVIILGNCPFHSLAGDYADQVCGMNLALLDGLLTSCDRIGLRARLDPAPRRCCVTMGNAETAQSVRCPIAGDRQSRTGQDVRSRTARTTAGVNHP
jgi:predicted ArsR family transcriptional regulator